MKKVITSIIYSSVPTLEVAFTGSILSSGLKVEVVIIGTVNTIVIPG